jgi:sugar lactone lactonase YvrE
MIGTQIFWGTNVRARSWRRATPCWSRRVCRVLRALVLGIAASVGSCAALGPAAAAAAGSCPNEQVRVEEPYAPALPDCRAYEQVSPVEKNYADALGAVTSARASASGEAVTFDSLGTFPLGGGSSGEGSSQLFSAYLSARGAEGWPTQNLEPGVNPGASASPLAVTEDLAYTFELSSNEPPLSSEPGVVEGRQAVYMREDQTGAYRLLFQLAAGESASFFLVAAAADDSRIFFESSNQLRPEALLGVRSLYEWHEGQLALVDLLPGGSPADGGAAGWRGPGASEEVIELPDHSHGQVSYFTENAVSEDGSRVYFTDLASGRLYLRESAPGGTGETLEVSNGPAGWQAATPDGSQAFYTEGGLLYRFDAQGGGGGQRTALTPAGAEVQGVLGVADDGSYVYFAAKSVLASGGVSDAGNIYVWHEGAIALVSSGGEEDDWTAHTLLYGSEARAGPNEGVRSARVSGDGHTLMFTSRASLTSYDNQGAGNHCTEQEAPAACDEVYVYDAGSGGAGSLRCVSCNPSGTPATSDALLYHAESDGSIPPPTLYPWELPRNLSADGSRVFFETEEALLPADSNSVMDVYEWEQEGAGSCPAGRSGGCLYLISSGVSSEPSYFAQTSSSGGDVFFFTRQSLVGQDEDELIDLYDARENGGIAGQNPPPPATPCLGEACHPAQAPVPAAGLPVSQVFSGAENLAPPVELKAVAKPKPKTCRKGYVRKKGRCVKKATHKRKGKKAVNKRRAKR